MRCYNVSVGVRWQRKLSDVADLRYMLSICSWDLCVSEAFVLHARWFFLRSLCFWCLCVACSMVVSEILLFLMPLCCLLNGYVGALCVAQQSSLSETFVLHARWLFLWSLCFMCMFLRSLCFICMFLRSLCCWCMFLRSLCCRSMRLEQGLPAPDKVFVIDNRTKTEEGDVLIMKDEDIWSEVNSSGACPSIHGTCDASLLARVGCTLPCCFTEPLAHWKRVLWCRSSKDRGIDVHTVPPVYACLSVGEA